MGEKEREAKSASPRLGVPGPPPRAEPKADHKLLELAGPRARALYRAPQLGSGWGVPGEGTELLPRRGLQATPPASSRLADVRHLPGFLLAAANFFLCGRGRRGLRAGQATAVPRASRRAWPRWVLLGGGGKIKLPFSRAS